MPKKKVVGKKIVPEEPKTELVPGTDKTLSPRWLVVVLAVLLAGGVLWLGKGLVVAGMVGNRPVWRWDMERRLIAQAGGPVFDQMVNERILENEAAARKIVVGLQEVDSRIAEIEKGLAGRITLKDALAQQGMTIDDLRQSVQIQILADKILATLPISDAEIRDYLAKNKDTMAATEEGKLQREARVALSQQKFQDFFSNLKKSTKVSKFI